MLYYDPCPIHIHTSHSQSHNSLLHIAQYTAHTKTSVLLQLKWCTHTSVLILIDDTGLFTVTIFCSNPCELFIYMYMYTYMYEMSAACTSRAITAAQVLQSPARASQSQDGCSVPCGAVPAKRRAPDVGRPRRSYLSPP